MYLSKVEFDLWRGTGLNLVSDFYHAHTFVATACGGSDRGRYLFRIEQEGARVWLLAQSEEKPAWEKAAERHGVELNGTAALSVFEPEDLVRTAPRVRFRVRANPIKTIKDKETAKQTRVPLKHEEQQRAWIKRRLSESGLDVVAVQITDEGQRENGGPVKRRTADSIVIYSVRFDGLARVTNADTLAGAIRSGIGPAKGFGFGLLSIAPVR